MALDLAAIVLSCAQVSIPSVLNIRNLLTLFKCLSSYKDSLNAVKAATFPHLESRGKPIWRRERGFSKQLDVCPPPSHTSSINYVGSRSTTPSDILCDREYSCVMTIFGNAHLQEQTS